MIIDSTSEERRGITEHHEGYVVWGPVNKPEQRGICRTHVAVNFDVCLADGASLEDCPVDVFEWTDTPGHPKSEIKADPVNEAQYTDYMLCVDVCPVDAIDVDAGQARGL
jgi:NAD-dependent dihydropyrimidine dehydrogenase PreA subunit